MLNERRRTTDVRLGIFVLLALAIVTVGSLWIAGSLPIGRKRAEYDVLLPRSGGIRVGDRVRVSGVKVGSIESIDLEPQKEWPVRVRVAIDGDLPINADATARLSSDGLLGSNYLEIILSNHVGEPLVAGSEIYGSGQGSLDATLAALEEVANRATDLLNQMGGVVDNLVGQIEPLTGRAEKLLSDENLEALAATLSNLEQITSDNAPALQSLIGRLEGLATNLEQGTESLPNLGQDLEALVSDLRGAIGPDGARLAEVIEQAQSLLGTAEGAVGALGEDGADLEALLRDLRATVSNLKEFSAMLARRPSAILRNAREPDRRPGGNP